MNTVRVTATLIFILVNFGQSFLSPLQGTTPIFLYPVRSPIITGPYTSAHKAVDMVEDGKPTGASIYASSGGKVTFRGWDAYCDVKDMKINPCGVYLSGGWTIKIDHGNGWETLYAHLSSISVSVGNTVTSLQKIGVMGNSGHLNGKPYTVDQTHLHFEIRSNGNKVNPMDYLGKCPFTPGQGDTTRP